MTDDQFKKMAADIPEELRKEETYSHLRDQLKDDPKNDPFSSVATCAMELATKGVNGAAQIMEEFNKGLGANYPAGDAVMIGGLLAAAQALSTLMIKRNPSSILSLMKITEVSQAVQPALVEALELFMSGEINGTGPLGLKTASSAAIKREDNK